MNYSDVIKNSVLEGFAYSDFTTTKMLVSLGITFLVAAYIFAVYRLLTRKTFYNRDFNVSMAIISMVTAGIVMAMQSSLVISLGMVGALSIVRFRTAIKEPMDLLFLFWSIGTGIICGAGLYELAILIALAVTLGLLVLQALPVAKSPYLLIVKAERSFCESDVMEKVKKYSPVMKIDSKSVSQTGVSLIIEIRTKEISELIDEVAVVPGVKSVTFMHHDGEVKA